MKARLITVAILLKTFFCCSYYVDDWNADVGHAADLCYDDVDVSSTRTSRSGKLCKVQGNFGDGLDTEQLAADKKRPRRP